MLALALLALRLAAGLTFAAHGAQKAFGWWQGPGPEGWRGAVDRMGFRPIDLFLLLSVGAELVGGLLLALGLLTPVAAAVLVAQAVVIIAKAHWSKGFFSQQGGFEHPLLLGVVAAAICLVGPGSLSLDAALGLPFPEPIRVALIPLALSVGFAVYLSTLVPEAPRQLPARSQRSERRRQAELRLRRH